MSKPIVVVPGPIRHDGLAVLQENCEVRQWKEKGAMPRELLKDWLKEADALWSMSGYQVDADLIKEAEKLKVVATSSVGYDNINIEDMTAAGVPVGNTPDVLTETVAELAFGLVVAANRRLYENIMFAKSGEWEHKYSPFKGIDLSRQTLGIIGMGKIGLSISRRARAFGMTVIYHNRTPRRDDNIFMTKYALLDDLLERSDVVLVAAPLNEDTYKMIGAETFKKMKNTALFVNIGRGKIVYTDALVAALKDGEIDYAALDVVDPEPLSAEHPLFKTGKCIITPHIASYTERTRHEMAMLTAENILRGVQLRALKTCVNPEVNYLALESEE